MQAFHNDHKVKTKYVNRVKAHRAADEIVRGYGYWAQGKGCAVGCTLHSADHGAYETELGIPRILARLEDGIFESLPLAKAKDWPLQFLTAIKVGADLSLVWPKFAVWMLTDPKHGVLQFANTDVTREAINSVADLYQLKAEGAEISVEDWQEARENAREARRAAAYAAAAYADADAAYAAYAAAAYAAYAAAAYADADAAYAAAAYAAYAAAARQFKRQEWRIAQSKKLLELLSECKA